MSVDVVIPVFNRPELARRAVQSVLAQTVSDYKLIVVDDGSTCDLSELKDLVESRGGTFVRTERKGVSHARNRGVASSSAKWIAFLDSDDEWLPDKLALQLACLEKNSSARIVHCNEIWIRNGKRVNPKDIHKKASGDAFERCLELCCISPSAVILERSLFEEKGLFDERMAVCEDYDLWIRVSSSENILLLEESLVVKYGGHEDQLSRSQYAMDRFRVFSMIKNLRDLDLTESQKDLLKRSILNKSGIIKNGADKHDNVRLSTLFEGIGTALSSPSVLQSQFELLEKNILDSVDYG